MRAMADATLDAAPRQISDSKLQPRYIYDNWHKLKIIFKGRFVASSVDRF